VGSFTHASQGLTSFVRGHLSA